jgi:mRNA interferase MazF
MTVNQGDVYWVMLPAAGAEPGAAHPHVVIQEDAINHSRVDTVVVCALTTNAKRVNEPGNVLLAAGEANLPKESIVVAAQVSSVRKDQLGEYIGTLSRQRVEQILAGMRFIQRMSRQQE